MYGPCLEAPIEFGKVSGYTAPACCHQWRPKNYHLWLRFDTIYALSNIFMFEVEVLQGKMLSEFQAGLQDGELDLAFPFRSNRFPSYQIHQIGKFEAFMDT